MSIISQPTSYSGILERVFTTTLFIGVYSGAVILFAAGFDLATASNFWINGVLCVSATALAAGFRAIRMHDKLSTILGLRRRFDTQHILTPLAQRSGYQVSEAELNLLDASRDVLMREAFYKYAGFIHPAIDEQLVRTAADNWGWFWVSLEGAALLLISTVVVFFTHAPMIAVPFLMVPATLMIVFMSVQWPAMKRAALRQVEAIVDDNGRAQAVSDAFGAVFSAKGLGPTTLGLGAPKNGEMEATNLLRENARIGIITALPKEFAAVKAMLDAPRDWVAEGSGSGRRYVLGAIPAGNRARAVVLAMLPDVGNNVAAARATQLLHHFPKVEHIIMCGIAGGIPAFEKPEDHIRLGDIVVSDKGGVIQYDFVAEKEGFIEPRHRPRPPSATLTEAHKFIEAEVLEGKRPWEQYIARAEHIEDGQRPSDEKDARGGYIHHPEDQRRRAGMPRVFSAPIAASNTLLRNATHRDQLMTDFGTRAVEMESSGIADAGWLSDRAGYFVIRGICDYCDSKKGDVWHGYAAIAAAAYLRALLSSPLAESDPSVSMNEVVSQ